jgi:hypothetical protein
MEAMAPVAAVPVHMPVTVNTVQVDVPAETVMTMDVNVPAQMDMTAVTMDVTDTMRAVRHVGAVHAVAAMTTDAVTATAAAMRTRISDGSCEGCHADNGRRDEGEESRTFEHCRRPLGSMWAIRTIGRGVAAIGSTD